MYVCLSLCSSLPPFIRRIKDQLDIILRDYDYHIHFFAEFRDMQPDEYIPGHNFIPKIFPESSMQYHLDVPATMMHFMNADMLITTGSSFAFMPASLSYKTTVLFERPKEGIWQKKLYEVGR